MYFWKFWLKWIGIVFLFAFSATAESTIPSGVAETEPFQPVWETILEEAGIKPEFIVTPIARKRRLFIDGLIMLDCCAPSYLRQQKEEKSVQLFSDAFFTLTEHYVFRKGEERTIEDADLATLRVAVIRGLDYIKSPLFGEIIEGRNIDDILTLVERNRADVGIITNVDFWFAQKKHPRPLILGNVESDGNLQVRVRKNAAYLLPRINEAIRRLNDTGRINALLSLPSLSPPKEGSK